MRYQDTAEAKCLADFLASNQMFRRLCSEHSRAVHAGEAKASSDLLSLVKKFVRDYQLATSAWVKAITCLHIGDSKAVSSMDKRMWNNLYFKIERLSNMVGDQLGDDKRLYRAKRDLTRAVAILAIDDLGSLKSENDAITARDIISSASNFIECELGKWFKEILSSRRGVAIDRRRAEVAMEIFYGSLLSEKGSSRFGVEQDELTEYLKSLSSIPDSFITPDVLKGSVIAFGNILNLDKSLVGLLTSKDYQTQAVFELFQDAAGSILRKL